MALNRDKFRKIVGGITTAEPGQQAVEKPAEVIGPAQHEQPAAGQGGGPVAPHGDSAAAETSGETRRFAKRGRPKGRKETPGADKIRKIKVSLFLSEILVNDLYEWAHDDRIHPSEMFERALKPFHEKEVKRRNGGKE